MPVATALSAAHLQGTTTLMADIHIQAQHSCSGDKGTWMPGVNSMNWMDARGLILY